MTQTSEVEINEREPSDAPVWMSADAASGWASGWNACRAEVIRQQIARAPEGDGVPAGEGATAP